MFESISLYGRSFKSLYILFLVILAGVGGGLGSILFHYLIAAFTTLFFGTGEQNFLETVVSLPWYYRLFIPALGGLIVGLLIQAARLPELHGEGVPEVKEALLLERGVIVGRVAPFKIVTAAITLGSGGAAGREGPIIQIGSAIGSYIGQKANLPTAEVRLLLAAGAAAGIAGTFAAPLAGIVFSIEILLRKISAFIIVCLSLAALTGSLVANYYAGLPGLVFEVLPSISFTPTQLPWLIVLVASALIIVYFFIQLLTTTQAVFAKIQLPQYVKPALGGLSVGALALVVPVIHEPASYDTMAAVLANTSTLGPLVLFGILFSKMLATSLTLGSGGSGGVLAPTLFIGVVLGSIVAQLGTFLPMSEPLSVELFALLGMAAMLSGIAHAPLSAAIIVFEITDATIALLLLFLVSGVMLAAVKLLRLKSLYSIDH